MILRFFFLVCVFLLFVVGSLNSLRAQDTIPENRPEMYERYMAPGVLAGGAIYPQWMADGSSFWFAEGSANNWTIYKINPEANTKEQMFDTQRLRSVLAKATGEELPGKGLPFSWFRFQNGEKEITFNIRGKNYSLQLDNYAIAPVSAARTSNRMSPSFPRTLGLDPWGRRSMRETLSPNKQWLATLKGHNVWLRSATGDTEVQLTTDGIEGHEYAHWWATEFARWSPDGNKLVVNKVDYRKVPKLPLVRWLEPMPKIEWITHNRADSDLGRTELFLVDVKTKRRTRVDLGDKPGQWIRLVPKGWRLGSPEFLLIRINQEGNKAELIAADVESGSTRVILTETGKSIPDRRSPRFLVQYLFSDGERFIARSFRDGWPHLYVHDLQGELICRLTKGELPVVEVLTVDEEAGWIYFTAHGDRKRPYDTHLYRVNLQGQQLSRLTEAIGEHRVQFSPSMQFILDSHSTVAHPPSIELRRTDGTLLQVLRTGKFKLNKLAELNWLPPEEFVVKAADGKTNLYGILYKPYDFDPGKKYPLIENIYPRGKPLTSHSFYSRDNRGSPVEAHALAQLGYIVFTVDARGTKERGKSFYEAGLEGKQLIADHVATINQLARDRPFIDVTRVGIYGSSGGGRATINALLQAPDVYHVGVAFSPAVDPRSTNLFIPTLGLYEKNEDAYKNEMTTRLAANLKGKLLMVQGTSDSITPFGGVMQMVDALAREGKPYDLLIVPEDGHGLSKYRKYVSSARRRYFQEHLKPTPFVKLTNPVKEGVEVIGPVVLRAKASASAAARVTQVDFQVDGVSVGVDPEPPYELNWTTETEGRHTVSAVVTDSTGSSEPSESITILVRK